MFNNSLYTKWIGEIADIILILILNDMKINNNGKNTRNSDFGNAGNGNTVLITFSEISFLLSYLYIHVPWLRISVGTTVVEI